MNQNNQNNQNNEVGFHEREFFVKEMVKAEKENEELKKEIEKLKEWKRNMKLFNGTDGIDSEEGDGDTDDEEDC